MKTILNPEIKSISQIIKDECQMRGFREINLRVYINGVPNCISKLFMYYRALTCEYMIVLDIENGYLVKTDFDSGNAQCEFLFLCTEGDAAKEGIPVTINYFTYKAYEYKLYDENMKLRLPEIEFLTSEFSLAV